MTRFVLFILSLIVWTLPLEASANTCSWTKGGPVAILSVSANSTVDINPNAGDGTLLGTYSATFAGVAGTYVNCSDPVSSYVARGTTGVPVNNIYPSSIPGVGLRFKYQAGPFLPWAVSLTPPMRSLLYSDAVFYIELIKTGPITGGGVITGEIAGEFTLPDNTQISSYRLTGAVVVNPTMPTCNVSMPDVQVDLIAAQVAAFTSVGTTLNEKAFKVSLACSGGDPGTKTAVWMSLADQTTPGNTTQVLSLTSASSATGVGVQILRNDVPISLNPVANRFKVQDVLPGSSIVDIPFKAQYIRTGTVTPGNVQAIATFTMDYL